MEPINRNNEYISLAPCNIWLHKCQPKKYPSYQGNKLIKCKKQQIYFFINLFCLKKPTQLNYNNMIQINESKLLFLVLQDIDRVYFKSENRTEWCGGPCYLFARKFSRGAAMRVLTNGLVGPYDPKTLFLDPTQTCSIGWMDVY